MEMNDMRKCILCEENKPNAEFNIEHVFPVEIGGFLTRHYE